VIDLDPDTNTVVVGSRRPVPGRRWRPIASTSCATTASCPIGCRPRSGTARRRRRRRSSGWRRTACELTFDEPQFAVTVGQSTVFYAGERLLGGGVIDRRRAVAA
jgi:tRNA-uridine 2-sulfurtransferase